MKLNLRNLRALVLAKLLIMLGLVRIAKRKALNGAFILSVYFHHPSKKEFESCIKWFKKNNFHFLSTDDLDQIINNGAPFPRGGVLLTVDDGWKSNEENIVSVANEYAVPITIFISTEPVEEGIFWWSYCLEAKKAHGYGSSLRAMKKMSNKERLAKLERLKQTVLIRREALTVEQVIDISKSKYITIGGHSHSHPILPNCDDADVRSEIDICKQKLESWTGKNVRYFSYPNGNHETREKQMLSEAGWYLAFGIHQKYLTPDLLKEPLSLPRFCFIEGASFQENICRILGVWKFSKQWLKENFSLPQHSNLLLFVLQLKRRFY